MTRQLKNINIEDLVVRYESLLLQQYTFRHYHNSEGKRDVRPWNRLADKIHAIQLELKSRGDEGVDAILPLIQHTNPNVSYCASVACLRRRTSHVLPVMEEKARTNCWLETKADFEGALEMWNEGKWIVD